MAREFAQPFYKSKAWQECRTAYLSQVNYLCERCDNPAAVVHHKKYINESNINNPAITLDWNNLEALCMECHNLEHMGGEAIAKGYTFTSAGDIVPL